MCLVTGKEEIIARLHEPKIKGVWGCQSAGALVVSFNDDAYKSFGKDQSYNAPVGVNAAFKYTNALNHLLSRNDRRISLGDASVVFWAEHYTADVKFISDILAEMPPPSDDAPVEDKQRAAQVRLFLSQMREGQLTDLSKAANGIIIGQALAEKLAVKNGNTVLLGGGQGAQTSATVVGIFRSGLKRVDEGQVYSLIGLAQTLMGQSGIINQLRLRLSDPVVAQKVATQVEAQIGYKSVSWQEANADLLSTFATRDFIVLTVMGAMLLTSSFATYNIISTITHGGAGSGY